MTRPTLPAMLEWLNNLEEISLSHGSINLDNELEMIVVIRDALAERGWQKINIPIVGKHIIVRNENDPDRIYSAVWSGKRWVLWNGKNTLYMIPTHFIEIPEAPKDE